MTASTAHTLPAVSTGSARGETQAAGRAFLSIGQVLAALRDDFPDVTISKIRFLEAEGLVSPERTSSGYRKFSRADVGRLRYVLGAQRDHYLPLRVIKENLAAMDRGLEPSADRAQEPQIPRALTVVEGAPQAESFAPDAVELRLSRSELLKAAGLSEETLTPLEQYGLITALSGGYYDGTALVVAKTAAALASFGVEPRHLRAFKTAADREIGLVEQVLSPLLGQRTADGRIRAEEVAREFAALSVALHAALVKAGLGPALRR
jgi:DNA-binding transcriptional MerR regulator